MQRRTHVHPETNAEMLGGEGRDDVRVTHNGMQIESDKPPPQGVTRLPGQGREGLRGLFDGQLTNQLENQQRQQRRQRNGTEAMNKYLRHGALDREDR
jgi:hypothetical protein